MYKCTRRHRSYACRIGTDLVSFEFEWAVLELVEVRSFYMNLARQLPRLEAHLRAITRLLFALLPMLCLQRINATPRLRILLRPFSTNTALHSGEKNRRMSYQQQFHTRLLQQLNDTNSRNLELQCLLAQKDDQLSTLNTRLSTALVSPGAGSGSQSDSQGHASIANLQRRNADTQRLLDHAQQAAAAAEGKLKSSTSRFQQIEADLRNQVNELQTELRHCNQQLKNRGGGGGGSQQPHKSAQWTASTGVAPRAELDAANAEVKRLRSAFASLQKQFEQEKKEGGQHRRFPIADSEKSRHIEHQDDEETMPR